MPKPLVAGNWKMHKTLAEARALVQALRDGLPSISGLDQVELLICPPFPLLFPMAKAVAETPIGLGAQNTHEATQGAYTGEVSAAMIRDTGARYVIVGHSERREHFGETHDRLASKVRAAQATGLNVIYCIGERLADREAGRTESVLREQLEKVIGPDVTTRQLVIAYEPVWAIGTGRNATPDQVREAHAFIRKTLSSIPGIAGAETVRIQYGGSVKPQNAGELLSQPNVDGALVGGASLVAKDFLGIIEACAVAAAQTSDR